MPTIIIVDDHRQISSIVAEYLRLLGYPDIVTFTDCNDAIEHVRELVSPPIVITDYMMPAMNGSQLLVRIKELNPKAQGIIMTRVPLDASADVDSTGFPVVDRKQFGFLDEIESIVRDFMIERNK